MAMVANRKKVVAVALLVAAVLLAWAWIDGGERRIRPMVQEVPVPETAR